jgi:DNA-binding IclR family transcriptional regulator
MTAAPVLPRHPLGTQGIQRAVAVLRELAVRERSGTRLMDMANALQLEHPTAHRILKALVAEGLARQDERTRRYHLGHLVYELGICVQPHFNLRELCEPALAALARKTEDSTFLMVRSGLDVVCVNTVEGTYPIKAHTLTVGSRRPLGVGAAGLALLMGLPQADIEQVLQLNAPRIARYGSMTAAHAQDMMKAARLTGYVVNDEDVMPGISAIGVALRRSRGTSYAALSIGAISSRLANPRREALAQLLLKEARALERKIEALGSFWD